MAITFGLRNVWDSTQRIFWVPTLGVLATARVKGIVPENVWICAFSRHGCMHFSLRHKHANFSVDIFNLRLGLLISNFLGLQLELHNIWTDLLGKQLLKLFSDTMFCCELSSKVVGIVSFINKDVVVLTISNLNCERQDFPPCCLVVLRWSQTLSCVEGIRQTHGLEELLVAHPCMFMAKSLCFRWLLLEGYCCLVELVIWWNLTKRILSARSLLTTLRVRCKNIGKLRGILIRNLLRLLGYSLTLDIGINILGLGGAWSFALVTVFGWRWTKRIGCLISKNLVLQVLDVHLLIQVQRLMLLQRHLPGWWWVSWIAGNLTTKASQWIVGHAFVDLLVLNRGKLRILGRYF